MSVQGIEMLSTVARELHISEEELLRQGLRRVLEHQLRAVKAEIFGISSRYGQPFQGIDRIRFSWPIFSQWRRDHRFCMPFVALASSWDRADVSCTVAG